MRFLSDWRFILIYVGIAGGLGALIFWGGGMSPIDRYMKGKEGGGITAMFSGNTSFGNAPKDGFELIGSQAGTQFAFVDPKHLGSQATMRAIGAAICQQAKSPDYCEVYFWNSREDIKVELPVTRGETLVAFYENKNGRAKLKMLQ